MGKTSTSETQNTYPEWLQRYLNPLIGGSSSRVGQFQDQGWEVLQGRNYRNAKPVNTGAVPRSSFAAPKRRKGKRS